jgi:hypothetical protein
VGKPSAERSAIRSGSNPPVGINIEFYMTSNTTKSLFAEALKGLIDHTKLFSRREWATFLGVKEATISEWLSEESIPRASHLNLIYVTVERASDANKEPFTRILEPKAPTSGTPEATCQANERSE